MLVSPRLYVYGNAACGVCRIYGSGSVRATVRPVNRPAYIEPRIYAIHVRFFQNVRIRAEIKIRILERFERCYNGFVRINSMKRNGSTDKGISGLRPVGRQGRDVVVGRFHHSDRIFTGKQRNGRNLYRSAEKKGFQAFQNRGVAAGYIPSIQPEKRGKSSGKRGENVIAPVRSVSECRSFDIGIYGVMVDDGREFRIRHSYRRGFCGILHPVIRRVQ